MIFIGNLWGIYREFIGNLLGIYREFTLPILDSLQKMMNSLLVNVDIAINTKGLKD